MSVRNFDRDGQTRDEEKREKIKGEMGKRGKDVIPEWD
jgi:hypothetical protein